MAACGGHWPSALELLEGMEEVSTGLEPQNIQLLKVRHRSSL